jgi:4-amino-4-deoxy-L-arabinose transferase-like glycosyltransferase
MRIYKSEDRRALLLLVCGSVVFFLISVASPPALMDDVDSVTAQIARTMVESGDWVTARLNGVAYFEKPALRFWMIAASYLLFGVHDWAARIPIALAAVVLCWLARAAGIWAFGSSRAGTLAGLTLLTSVGFFLFTRILIPDIVLTFTTMLAMWSLLRCLEENEPNPRRWSALFAAGLGLGFMLKGLVAFVFPIGAGLVYLAVTRRLLNQETWRRIRPLSSLLIVLAICLPWIILSINRNPPHFDFTMKSEPGRYRGFFWFFFLNEHLFRYLNLRHPRDYNTVPRAAFWLYHLLWLFPWSVFFPFLARLDYRPESRAGRMRLFCLCWIGVTLLFFTFSTTQEYYSMPCYPALGLLLGSALDDRRFDFKWSIRAAGVITAMAAIAGGVVLWLVRDITPVGDITGAMNNNVSTLSLGKAQDLTLASLAWLRGPLLLAIVAFLVGAAGAWWKSGRYAILSLAVMMLLVFNAARWAMITLNPHFGSRSLALALNSAPPGELIVDDQYYSFSSVFFYANRRAKLLNGRKMNLEYGSYAPDAPDVFINDQALQSQWGLDDRLYLTAADSALPRLISLLGESQIYVVNVASGKYLFTNQPLGASQTLQEMLARQPKLP